jgi:hypothetical protein
MFIDWINISQTHEAGGLPVVSSGFKTDTDENAEILSQFRKKKWIEGSHSTAVMILCDGNTVTFSGNIGRLGRKDNVFNLDFDQTIQKLNALCDSLGLPHFSSGKVYMDRDGKRQTTGAVVTKLDATCNYLTGSPENLGALQNWLEGQTMAYIRKGRKLGATTTVWGSRKGRYQLEAYDKAQEMLDHAKGDLKKQEVKDSQIYKYCKENGVLRVELKMARQALEQNGMRFLEEIDMNKITRLFDEKTEILQRGRRLEKSFEVEQLPRKLRQTAQVYLAGGDVRIGVSDSTFKRQAKALREFGIDIATAYNVTRLPIKIREITIQQAIAPDWYWKEAA